MTKCKMVSRKTFFGLTFHKVRKVMKKERYLQIAASDGTVHQKYCVGIFFKLSVQQSQNCTWHATLEQLAKKKVDELFKRQERTSSYLCGENIGILVKYCNG